MSNRREPALLTININADTDSVIVDGVEYDRSKMSRDEKRMMRRIIVDGLYPRKGNR